MTNHWRSRHRQAHHRALRSGFWVIGSTFSGAASAVQGAADHWAPAIFYLVLMLLCLRALFRSEVNR